MFKRALVSVSHKEGLIEFLKPISQSGCEIVSTGGTSKFLRDNGIKVVEVGEATGFPEMMDGRVRTLHPKIHMGLLARSFVPEDFELLKEYGVKPFDLVVVNLYPFEAALNKGLKGQDLIEQIDIGGPSLLRAAAKSHERVTVVCDPSDYPDLLQKATDKTLDEAQRRNLAVKVFEHCSYYDSVVARGLRTKDWTETKEMTLGYKKHANLRYGENPHQKAVWYVGGEAHPLGLHLAEKLQGKELSFNNILDLEAAVGAVADFDEPCSVIVKHLTPCGVAVDKNINNAYKRAFDADSVSAFGGIVALNRSIDGALAKELVGPFLECIIAPEVTPEAQEIFKAKKNLRVMTLKNLGAKSNSKSVTLEVRGLRGGALIQSADEAISWSDSWKIVGPTPTDEIKKDMIFAQRVVRHVKSNAIVVAKNLQTFGVCGGQTNRVDSARMALERAKSKGQKDLVLGSDAFFPFADSIELAAKWDVKWIIQPGGSLRDAEVEEAARKYNIGMVITGTRHFKH